MLFNIIVNNEGPNQTAPESNLGLHTFSGTFCYFTNVQYFKTLPHIM